MYFLITSGIKVHVVNKKRTGVLGVEANHQRQNAWRPLL